MQTYPRSWRRPFWVSVDFFYTMKIINCIRFDKCHRDDFEHPLSDDLDHRLGCFCATIGIFVWKLSEHRLDYSER